MNKSLFALVLATAFLGACWGKKKTEAPVEAPATETVETLEAATTSSDDMNSMDMSMDEEGSEK